MSTDNGTGEALPELKGFRPALPLLATLKAWRLKYATDHGMDEKSVKWQFVFSYLLTKALRSEGFELPSDASSESADQEE